MKLVIDIPQGMIDAFSHEEQWTAVLCRDMSTILQNGTPYEERPKVDVLNKIPKDFVYDTETSEFYCYRNKYTGEEIHIIKSPKTYILADEIGQRPAEWCDDKCSVCGKGIEDLISSPEWYRNEEPNFCPFCGARVRRCDV